MKCHQDSQTTRDQVEEPSLDTSPTIISTNLELFYPFTSKCRALIDTAAWSIDEVKPLLHQ